MRLSLLIVFFALSSSFAAEAVTRGQFVGQYGIIRILARDFVGTLDTDGQSLYEAMDVPSRNDAVLGSGKSIETLDKSLQIICANRPQIGYECSLFIHNRPHGLVDLTNKTMSYKVTGSQAKAYGHFFKTNPAGEFLFNSADGSLSLSVKPGSFEVSYTQNQAQQAHITSERKRFKDSTTLVVVNVEDTLKIAHVRNFWDSLNYTSDTRKRFLGMNSILSLLSTNNPSFRFVYLTENPALVSGKAQAEFLNKNDFPRGENLTYSSNADKISRVEVLRGLFIQPNIARVIFIGHNGNEDAEVLHDLSSKLTDISFLPYFHMIYSTSSMSELGTALSPEQTGFVTAVELMVDWQQKSLVDFTQAVEMTKSLVPRIIGEKADAFGVYEYSLPSFVNCSDFQWKWSVADDYQYLTPLRDLLEQRCHSN